MFRLSRAIVAFGLLLGAQMARAEEEKVFIAFWVDEKMQPVAQCGTSLVSRNLETVVGTKAEVKSRYDAHSGRKKVIRSSEASHWAVVEIRTVHKGVCEDDVEYAIAGGSSAEAARNRALGSFASQSSRVDAFGNRITAIVLEQGSFRASLD